MPGDEHVLIAANIGGIRFRRPEIAAAMERRAYEPVPIAVDSVQEESARPLYWRSIVSDHCKAMSLKLTRFRRDAAEQEQTQRPDVDSTTIIGNTNYARLSFEPRLSSRNSSTQCSILDPPPLYALSLHEVTRGYEYLGPVFPVPQGPGHRLGNIRLIAHDPEDERATSLLGAATRNLDLVDLSKATPEQIQQLQL